MELETRRFSDLDEISRCAAELISAAARRSVDERGVFTLVLSGGETPKRLYRELAGPMFRDATPWGEMHFFWGDERCVPQDHPYSNYATAWETLLSVVPVRPSNIHRIPAEISPPEEAALAYEGTLRNVVQDLADGGLDSCSAECCARLSFDLVLLGMGSDGHTASLFPGDPSVEERDRWVVAVPGHSALPPVPRITMTLPAINEAQCVLFLISGHDKKKIFQTILADSEAASRLYPAARVRPKGRLIWFTD